MIKLTAAYTDSEEENLSSDGDETNNRVFSSGDALRSRVSDFPGGSNSGDTSPIGEEPSPPRPNMHEGTPDFSVTPQAGFSRTTSAVALVAYSSNVVGEEIATHEQQSPSHGSGIPSNDGAKGAQFSIEEGILENTDKGASDDLDVYDYLERTYDDAENGIKSSRKHESVEVRLPPPVQGVCSPSLQRKFDEYLQKKLATGYSANAAIQRRKDFRNPSMYEKLIHHLNIDEIGSNFSKGMFDPHAFKSSDFYDDIAKHQKLLMDKLEKEKSSKGVESPRCLQSVSTLIDEKKRKSKWDVPTSSNCSTSQQPLPTSRPSSLGADKSVNSLDVASVSFGKRPKI